MTLALAACGGGGGGGGTTRTPETIVYTADQRTAGNMELFAVRDDGGGHRRLSDDMQPTGNVAVFKRSPDGQKVAYLADARTDDVLELFVVDADGGNHVTVSQGISGNADVYHGNTPDAFWWSPDSTRLVYLADSEFDDIQELYLVNADGSDHHRINGPVGDPPVIRIGQAAWSPDSRYVAYFVRSLDPHFGGYATDRIAINTHDTTIGGRNSVRVSGTLPTSQNQDWISQMVWSPDSTRIAYTSYENTPDLREGYIAVAGQTTQQTRFSLPIGSGQGVYFRLHWSSDGRQLLYAITGTDGGLYTHDTTNATPRNAVRISGPLVSGGGISRFAWSPNDARVAYTADQDVDGTTELYSALPDVVDSSVKVSGTLPAGGNVTAFHWSPDSTRIAYIADQDTDGVNEAYVASADGGGATTKVSGALTGDDTVRDMLTWSPDNLLLAYEVQGQAAGLYVTSPDAGTIALRVTGNTYGETARFHYRQTHADDYFTSTAWSSDSSTLIFGATTNQSLGGEPTVLRSAPASSVIPRTLAEFDDGANGLRRFDY